MTSIIRSRLAALGIEGSADVDTRRRLLFIRLPGDVPPVASVAWETAELRFREVLGLIPFGPAAMPPAARQVAGTCENGKLVTPRDKDVASANNVILADKADARGHHLACYVLGPTIMTGHSIGMARSVRDPSSGWQIDVHFKNDDFLHLIAGPYVGKTVAIVLDGIVESAPTINTGITGRDVTISGTFTETEAAHIALVLRDGSLPVQLQLVSITHTP
jgi:hypothetical protein